MARGPTYSVKFRRRREGKTNYKKRIKLLLSRKPRLVIRKTNKYIIAQIVEFDPKGDRTIVYATSKELTKYGWNFPSFKNLPAAYLTGFLLGMKAKKKGIKEAILDIGLHPVTKGNRIFTCYRGFLDAGINSPHSEDYFPDKDRIKGEHIVEYYKILKEKGEEFLKRQFGKYKEESIMRLPEIFEEVKNNIMREFGEK